MTQWIIDNITVLAGYAGVGILWVWKGSAFIHRANTAFDKIEHLDTRVTSIENYLHAMGGFMKGKSKNFPQLKDFVLIQSHSPITLTEQGEEFVNQSGFPDFVKDHPAIWQEIADMARGRGDAAAYIEKHAMTKVTALFDDDDIRLAKVSDFSYQQGLRESTAKMNEAMRAFGVIARDHTMRLIDIDPPVAPPPQEDELA